jgi:hypothetical protein
MPYTKNMDKEEEKRTTSEKPVSLSPLNLKEALTGLLEVKPEEEEKRAKKEVFISREEQEMTEDTCKQERLDLETAKNNLQNHQANPLDWDKSSELYQRNLSELKAEVAKKEKILSDCEAKE